MIFKTLHKPPQRSPTFTNDPKRLVTDAKYAIDTLKLVCDRIAEEVTLEEACFETVILPLAQAEDRFNCCFHATTFQCGPAPDEGLREASRKAEELFSSAKLDIYQREDLFSLVDAVRRGDGHLDIESQRLVERKHSYFHRNGLGIACSKQRQQFKDIQAKITQLCSTFKENLSKPMAVIWVTREELDGLPGEILSEFECETQRGENFGKLRIPLEPFYIATIQSLVKSGRVRKICSFEYPNRCRDNVAVFKEVIVLRDEAARLLGYRNHAQFRLRDRMAGTTKVVDEFLRDMRLRTMPLVMKELAKLKQLKEEDLRKRDVPDEKELFLWDLTYYGNLLKQCDDGIDQQVLSEYFALWPCLKQLLAIFSQLLGLEFHGVYEPDAARADTATEGKLKWHGDVKIYAVWDKPAEDEPAFLGYLYLDLYQREGKRDQAYNANILPGFQKDDGSRHYPATALLCSYNKPVKSDKPCLLRYNQVVELFHEMGHAMHNLVSKTRYSEFHGTAVADDFCEAPSQMLENWAWIPSVIHRLNHHWSYIDDEHLSIWKKQNADEKQPSEKLDDSTIQHLIRSKTVNGARDCLDNIHLSMFDIMVHDPKQHGDISTLNVAAVFNRLRRDITPVSDFTYFGQPDDWGHGYTNWVHPVEGYDCAYYGYLYSEVFAIDMFDSVFRSDPMSAEAGMRYRRQVLEKGGSQDEMITLTNFLGRKPTLEAFYRERNLNSDLEDKC